MPLSLSRERPPRHLLPGQRGFRPLIAPFGVLAGVSLVATAFITYVLWPRWPAPVTDPDAPALPIIVAGVTFNVPPAAIRAPVQRRAGTHERIDLSFRWPSLEPPDPSAKPQLPAHDVPPAQMLERVFVTIAAADDSIHPVERALTIYPRYTEAEASSGPGGLTLLPFRDDTPYHGEDLLYDGEAPGFLVRCTRNAGATPGICLYERWIERAMLVVRFPRDWLIDWRAVAGNIDRLIARLRRSPSG